MRRIVLMMILGLVLGGGVTGAWWLASRFGVAPGAFTDCTLFTGIAMMVAGLMVARGSASSPGSSGAAPGTGKGPLGLISSTKSLARDISQENGKDARKGIPGTLQACALLLTASLVLFVAAAAGFLM